MRLSDLSIRRPMLAAVMSLMLVLLGVMAYEPLRDTSVLFGSTIVSCSPCAHEVN